MLLEEITLENYGLYAGRQSIRLEPESSDRPVVLIGGLNGRGKTTLLDAVQLCLYGKFAQCSARKDSSYPDFLKRSIHQNSQTRTASISLVIQNTVDGERQRYRIERSWELRGESVSEKLSVERNGIEDEFLSQRWVEAVENIFPRRVAGLFLFDGEKIEAYADRNESAALVETAIHNLLGLDIVDQLERDLSILQQRKRKIGVDETLRRKIEGYESEYRTLSDRCKALRSEVAALRAHQLPRAKKNLEAIELEFKQKGGDILARQAEIESAIEANDHLLDDLRAQLRVLAASEVPLQLVEPLLHRMAEREQLERDADREAQILTELRERDRSIVAKMRENRISGAAIAELERFMNSEIESRSERARIERILEVTPRLSQQIAGLLNGQLSQKVEELNNCLQRYRATRERQDALLNERASIPARDAVADLLVARDEAKTELAVVEAKIQDVENEIERLERQRLKVRQSLVKNLERKVGNDFEIEGAKRVIEHAEKVKTTLKRFRGRVLRQNIERIEECISSCLEQLLGKTDLIKQISIDVDSFKLRLIGRNEDEISPERLSAGERQLLAISVLWGLARASGRQLPTIVDTPLSRLDSEHRARLLERYFPHASHQVILLSTDEEINGENLHLLEPHISQSYSLIYEPHSQATKVYDGYFVPREVASAG